MPAIIPSSDAHFSDRTQYATSLEDDNDGDGNDDDDEFEVFSDC